MKAKSVIILLTLIIQCISISLYGVSIEIEIGDTVHLESTYQLTFKPTAIVFIEEFVNIPDYASAFSDSVNIDDSNLATMYFGLTLKSGAQNGNSYQKNFSYFFYNSTESEKVNFYYSIKTPTPLSANFTSDKTSGSYPLNVQFTNTSSGDITNYSWDFGDGNTSNEVNPNHTYTSAGLYTVSLTVTGTGGTETETKTDYIYATDPAAIEAQFSGSPVSGMYPLNVQFTDNSTGDIFQWQWDFGDGSTSSVQNPNHTYSEAGTYTVILSVTGAGGNDTEIKTDYITVSEPHVPEPGVLFDPEYYNPEKLPAGMSIVTFNGEKYLKVNLNGWDNFIDIDDYIITSDYSHFIAKVKYEVVSSGYPFSAINTFLKLLTPDWSVEIAAQGNPSSLDFEEYLVGIIVNETAGILQVAGQETNEWNPTFGDIMWIGKVTLVDRSKPTRPDNLIADVEGSKVMLSWDPSNDNAGIAGYIISQNDIRLDSISDTNYEVTDVSDGTHTFGVVSVDLSGNLSSAKKVNVTVGTTVINMTNIEHLNIYPNPASASCVLNLMLQKSASVKIEVYNSQGQIVRNCNYGLLAADNYKLEMDISDLPGGFYYISIKTNTFKSIQRLMILR